MNRIAFCCLLLLLGFPVQGLAFEDPAAGGKNLPNVIHIMSDDQGWGDVGFNGNAEVQTPNLDALAADGVKFDRFYAASPLCSPSRGSCLTGRYPFRFGVLAAHTGGMRVGEITIAEMLKKKGYSTGFFGKWHLGWVKEADAGSRGFFSPPGEHGFEHWFATTSAVPTWDPTMTPEGWNQWGNKEGKPWKGGAPYVENGKEVTENMAGDDSRIIMDRVVDFVNEKKDDKKPFFATVWFHAPHEPVVAGEKYKQLYPNLKENQKDYYGCITAMDEQIGRLRKTLQDNGMADNTIIFFNSDNGPADGLAKKGVASAGKFKGHKHQMYEGGTLVPACAVWPGVIPKGAVTQVRCATVDYLPTIADIVDYQLPDERPIDGVNLLPIIRGEVAQRPTDLFFAYRRLFGGIDGQGLIRGDWKVLREAKKNPRVRLYNLASDPYEQKDLAKKYPDRLKAMEDAMQADDESCALSRDGADYRY